LGRLDQSQNWFQKVFTLGDARKTKLAALENPYLEPLCRVPTFPAWGQRRRVCH
jgi:hypothetical protein